MRALVLVIALCLPRVVTADEVARLNPDPDDPVGRAVKAKAKDFRQCFSRELDRNPKLKGGKVVLAVGLDTAGAVKATRVKSTTLKIKRVETCLVGVMKMMTFPAEAPRTFNFPFVFSQGG
jgi:hypothetical protein